MDVSAIANLATGMAQSRHEDAISIAMLKKTMDMQSAMAIQLIAAMDTASTPASKPVAGSTSNLPVHLGRNINTIA